MGELNIVTCADARFAIGAWITIWSTYKYTSESRDLRFHFADNKFEFLGIRKEADARSEMGHQTFD